MGWTGHVAHDYHEWRERFPDSEQQLLLVLPYIAELAAKVEHDFVESLLTCQQLRNLLSGPDDGASLNVQFTSEAGWREVREVREVRDGR